MSFTGKVALITGGSKGIGRAITEKLDSHGAKFAINYSSDTVATGNVVTNLRDENLFSIMADAGSTRDIASIVDQTICKFNILIPSAAINPLANLEELTEELYDRMDAVNVKGALFIAKAAVPHMPAGSHIVFISASLCHPNTVQPRHLPYCLNRGTIEQIARILSKDLAPKGVIVNSIAPGPAGTEMFRRGKPESMAEEIKRQSPFNRLGEPEEIADAVLFTTATTWVAGQTLRCNGSLD